MSEEQFAIFDLGNFKNILTIFFTTFVKSMFNWDS